MTEASMRTSRGDLSAHDHAVCVYETEADIVRTVKHFLDSGIARRDLCIFIHSFETEEEAWRLLEMAMPGVRRLSGDEVVVVSLYRDAFQGESARIDYDHVMGVVDGLVKRSKAAGRHGVRVFVDASRVYFKEKRSREWFDFEAWLGRRLQAAVGLVCAYRREDAMRSDLFPEMLRTHSYRFDAPGAP